MVPAPPDRSYGESNCGPPYLVQRQSPLNQLQLTFILFAKIFLLLLMLKQLLLLKKIGPNKP
jgi:hypothetical protein